jgi:hypothetical protein
VCPSDSFSILNIGRPFLSGAVAGYQYEIMAQPGEAVGIDSANPSKSASDLEGRYRSHWLLLFVNSSSVVGFANPCSCNIRVCTASAIRKQLKQKDDIDS